jgi:hypothetical protein
MFLPTVINTRHDKFCQGDIKVLGLKADTNTTTLCLDISCIIMLYS